MKHRTHTISWNLTRRCNLKCTHCYLDADFRAGRKVNELTTQDCYKIIEQIAVVNPNALLILTGGEPLMRSDIFNIARYASTRKFFVVIATNGTPVNLKNIQRMITAGIKGISISLHSGQPEKHDSFAGVPGSWQAVIKCTKLLREAGLEFVIQTSVMSWNYDEIPQIIDLAHDLGAKFFNLYFLVCTGRGQGVTDVSSSQYESMLTRLYVFQKKYLGRMLISAKCTPQYKRIIYEANPSSPFLKSYMGGCPAAIHYCQIDPEGNVTPCPYMPIKVGNVRNESFNRLWQDAPLLKELRDRSLLEGRCGACEFKSVCSGCRARAYAETNNYLAEDSSCAYEPGKYGFKEIILTEEETFGTEAQFELHWDTDAQIRLQNIPTFARGMVIKGVEHFARENQFPTVTIKVMKQARTAITSRRRAIIPDMQGND